MSEAGTAQGQPGGEMPLHDGRMLRVDGQGVHAGATLYPLDEIQDARVIAPEPRTIGLRVAGAGLVTLVPVRAEDAEAALDQLYALRPALRPAGYVSPSTGQPAPALPGYPPPVYGMPPAYAPPPGYPPLYPPPYGPPPGYGPPIYGAPLGAPGYPPPGASFVPAYGPPPAFPGYSVVPPTGGAPGSPENEGGVGFWPQGIGEVIGTGFRLYFKRFGGLVALGLIVGLWPGLLSSALQVGLYYAEGYDLTKGTLTQASPFLTSGGTPTNIPFFQWVLHPTAAEIGMFVGGAMLWLVLSLVLGAWAIAAMSLGAREAVAGRPVRVGRALLGGLRRLPAVLGVVLIEVVGVIALVGLFIALIAALVMVLAGAMAASAGSDSSTPGGSAAAGALGTLCGLFALELLFGLVYIYLMYRVYLAQFAAAADRLNPFTAIGRSWSLTWRNWWRAFLPLLVVGIVVGIAAAVSSMVGYFSIIAGSLIALPLITAVTQPLTVVTALVVYYDLRLRREGYPTLALELGLFGLPQPAPPMPPAPPATGQTPTPSGPAQPDHPPLG